MRIIQIIDSLEAGGAERMAVSYANALADTIDFSGLVASRKEGPLLNQIDKKVSYLFLNKKGLIDFKAVLRLRCFVKKNKVTHVQAHSTSFFLAFLVKLSCPSVQLVWHNHYGNSEILAKKKLIILRIIIPFFDGVIAVNQKLKIWAEEKLNFKNTIYLPNFAIKENAVCVDTILKGMEGKRIVCLANLREDKNHFLLLNVASRLKKSHPDWTFHLVGKDFEDDYAAQIKKIIQEFDLRNTVFLYGTKQDIANILNQSEIAILTSQSEGLPVALLEYGLSKKAVIVTDVGEIPFVIQHRVNGLVVPNQNEQLFYDAIFECIGNEVFREELGDCLYKTINQNFSEKAIIENYLNWVAAI
jgi:glycosyltransferase involved in cell wall biosynthesis